MGHLLTILVLINVLVYSCLAITDNVKLLEAQFVSVENEIKAASSKSDVVHEADQKKWFEIGTEFDPKIVKNEWVRIHNASEIDPNNSEHIFKVVNLSFPFPLFGGVHNQLIVSTAGALLTGNPEDTMLLPSHIAPFLSNMLPNERDTTLFYNEESYFLIQWEKHIDGDDHHMLKFRAKIFPDGTIRFIYRNFLKIAVEAAQKNGYPAIVGLQDGFSVPKAEGEKGSDVYLYPSVLISLDQLWDNEWAMITLTPTPGCTGRTTDACTNDCTRCKENECVYNMELNRPLSVCNIKESLNCSNICPLDLQPVCGSDGITYSNLCLLKSAACEQMKSIDVKKEGNCETTATPRENVNYCKVKCPKIVSPVCGTDNQTYKNKCTLFQQNCLKNQTVQIGFATGCPLVNYDYTEIKETQGDDDEYLDEEITLDNNSTTSSTTTTSNPSAMNNSNPDCQMVCNSSDKPVVCLNGKIVFGNMCMMKVTACQQNLQIQNVTDGFCKTENEQIGNVQTGNETELNKPEIYNCDVSRGCPVTNSPVCGSNKITYQNECSLRQINCLHKLNLTIIKQGKCSDELTNDQKTSNCNPVCTREMNPVCGSDGVTYNNPCLLKFAICSNNNSMNMLYPGKCNETASSLGQYVNVPANFIPTENEQYEEDSKLNDEDTDESHKSSSTKLMGVAGLVIFFALVALTVLYRRRKIMRTAQLANPSPRASTDSWLYPEPHEFRDEVNHAPSASAEVTTSRNWELGDFQRSRVPKNDKLPLVPNIELEDPKDCGL